MQRTSGNTRRFTGIVAVAAVLLAGCAGDIAGELSRNVQVRERVMTAIAADSTLAGEMTQRLLVNDSLRRRVIEKIGRASCRERV